MSATLPERLELPIEGMTCASCASRIEKRLNKLEGVEATVNYATENAAVHFDPSRVAPEDLIGAIEAAGLRMERCRRFPFKPGPLMTVVEPHVIGIARRP